MYPLNGPIHPQVRNPGRVRLSLVSRAQEGFPFETLRMRRDDAC
jgi:hypothetical protein